MAQYINKDALVAEIEKRTKETESLPSTFDQFWAGQISAFKGVLKILDTLEVKEVQEEHVSKNLEETAKNYSSIIRTISPQWESEIERAFIAGAKWGKNQAKVEIQAQSMALAHGCPKENTSNELKRKISMSKADKETL